MYGTLKKNMMMFVFVRCQDQKECFQSLLKLTVISHKMNWSHAEHVSDFSPKLFFFLNLISFLNTYPTAHLSFFSMHFLDFFIIVNQCPYNLHAKLCKTMITTMSYLD